MAYIKPPTFNLIESNKKRTMYDTFTLLTITKMYHCRLIKKIQHRRKYSKFEVNQGMKSVLKWRPRTGLRNPGRLKTHCFDDTAAITRGIETSDNHGEPNAADK